METSTRAEKLLPKVTEMTDEESARVIAEAESKQFAYLMNLSTDRAKDIYQANLGEVERYKNSIKSMFDEINQLRIQNNFLKSHYEIVKKKEKLIDISDIRPFESKEIFYKYVNYVKIRDLSLAIYCILGVSYGLRHSDIVKLKLKDVVEYIETKKINKSDVLKFKDKKTKKPNWIEFEDIHIQIVENYVKKVFADVEHNDNTPFIIDVKTRRGFVYNSTIDRLKRYAKEIGLNPKHIGSHTLRKSFGFFMHLDGKSVEEIMKALNHSKPETTLRYIGITPEQARKNKIANLPGLNGFVDD